MGSDEVRAAARRSCAGLFVLLLAFVIESEASADKVLLNDVTRPRSVVGVDLLRLGFPAGMGVGFRAFPIPQLALEAGVASMGIATGMEFALATLPLPRGPDRRMQPMLRFGYRRLFVHEVSDRLVRRVLPAGARSLSEEIVLYGTRIDALFVSAGFSYRFSRPVILELSFGHLSQVGSGRGNGGREALQVKRMRIPVGEIRVTLLLPRGRRP